MKKQTVSVSLIALVASISTGCNSLPPDMPGSGQTIPGTCPTTQQAFAQLIPATYAVVLEFRPRRSSTNTDFFTLGTAFAIGSRKLATNAHIVDGILDFPLPIERVLVIQSGTGRVIEVVSAAISPQYTGDPLGSPDVGVLLTQEEMPSVVELLPRRELPDFSAGDMLALTGFPGDVNELFTIVPGSVPHATSLSGTITALRSFQTGAILSPETIDIIQHQIPTTPGTSGSPLALCGKVVGLHNAGTVNLFVTVDGSGNLIIDRQTAAANNFGIHVKYLHSLVSLLDERLVDRIALPPPGPRIVDSDGDGFSDDTERNGTPGTDPFDPTDNPNNVRDTDDDGCSDFDELNFNGFCDNDPRTPASAFDGVWVAAGTITPGQGIVGPSGVTIEVSGNRPACVAEHGTIPCQNLDFAHPTQSRPITLLDGVIEIAFTMRFSACTYQDIFLLDNESLVNVTITGFSIPGTSGLVFDAIFEQHFVFSGITLLSTGTLDHFPSDTRNSCE